MIPKHLIDQAAQAIVTGMFRTLLLADMHPEDAAYARADARAALEAVAADIWEDGYEAGASDEHAINTSDKHGKEWPKLTPNPYRNEHT